MDGYRILIIFRLRSTKETDWRGGAHFKIERKKRLKTNFLTGLVFCSLSQNFLLKKFSTMIPNTLLIIVHSQYR